MFAGFRRKIPAGVSAEAWQSALSDKRPLIITIHGTGDTDAADAGPKWWQRGSEFQTKLSASAPADQQPVWLPFRWSGANSDAERFSAAADLARLCGALSRRGRDYSILGHSHAGNVMEYAWSFFGHEAGKPSRCLRVVTYGVPFFRSDRTLLNQAAFLFNSLAFVPLLIGSAMVLIRFPFEILFAARSISLGGFTIAFLSDHPILEYLAFPYFVLPPAYVAASFAAWTFGFRYLWGGAIAKWRWQGKFSSQWLALIATRDEVLGLLPKLSRIKSNYVTPKAVKSAIQAPGILFGLVVGFGVTALSLGTSLFGTRTIFIPGFGQDVTLWTWLGGIERIALGFIFGFATYFAFRLSGHLVSLMPGKRFAARLASDQVHNILKASAYGQDFNFNLRTVEPEPQRMRVRLHRLDKDDLGGLSPEVVETAVAGLYDGVIGFESAEQLAADPEGLWAKLMNALYHNAYFDDDEVIALTANHLWPSTTGNAPGSSTALVSPA
jgi:hypothetical protein